MKEQNKKLTIAETGFRTVANTGEEGGQSYLCKV